MKKLLGEYNYPQLIDDGVLARKKFYIAMKFLGKPLSDIIIEMNQKCSLVGVTMIAMKTLNILKDFHSKGLIHNDIKPNNLLLGMR